MFDSHSHLFEEEFEEDLEECIKRARQNKVKKCMLVGYSHSSNQKAFELASKHPDFFYNSCGIHPSEVRHHLQEDMKLLEDFIQTHKVYALGEIGLDYHYENSKPELQKQYFEAQMILAKKYSLPVIIHSRDSIEDTYEVLKKFKNQVVGVMHCYSSSYEMALKFMDLGYYISLGGPVTFKNAKVPKKVAKEIPLQRLLIETDSPYLAPTPFRGKRNETGNVIYVAEEIAKLRNIDIQSLCNVTMQNTYRLFNLEEL